MGGTFNPIHIGHLILAETAFFVLNLDEVVFMPSKNPPHKNKKHILPDSIREDMIKCAIQDNTHFRYSDLELKRSGITYTADTLTYLKSEYHDIEYFFLMGADSFFAIEEWYKPEVILKLCHIAVAVRNDVSMKKLQEHSLKLEKKYNARISFLNMPNIDISSSAIRNDIAKNVFVKYYVPSEVFDYIRKNNLYI